MSGEVKNVLNCGRLLVDVVSGKVGRETVRFENVDVEFCCLEWVRDGAVKPAKCVICSEYASLSVVPPFL